MLFLSEMDLCVSRVVALLISKEWTLLFTNGNNESYKGCLLTVAKDRWMRAIIKMIDEEGNPDARLNVMNTECGVYDAKSECRTPNRCYKSREFTYSGSTTKAKYSSSHA